MDNVSIGVTPQIDNVVLNAGVNNQIIDITLVETAEVVQLDITPNLIEINIIRSEGEVQILQFASYSNFPATGKANYFYLAKDTNKLYRWTGTAYAELNALGYTAENVANKGVANGYAGLDSGGKVPSSQLPSYVDDVIEVANYAALPATGETGKIYITLDTNNIYRWSGSVYVEISTDKAVWGGITGTLSNQTDLQTALNAKQDDLNGTGFVKALGTTITYDNNTYLTTSAAASTYVPYTGATQGVNLGEFGVNAGYVKLDTTPTSTPTGVGTLYWDTANRTASLVDGDGDTTLQIGQEERVLVHNNTGSTLTDGQVVYVTGSTGELPSVALAVNTTDSTSSVTFGVVTESIANGADGFITTSGIVHGLNTNAFTEGAALWLGATAGTFTQTKPVAPNHSVLIGYVIKKAGGNGSIFVKIQNGYELEELHNVLITSEANNDGLFYESSTGLWKNKTLASILGYTPSNDANVVHKTGDESIAGTKTFTATTLVNLLKFNETAGFNNTPGYTQVGGSADNFNFINGAGTKSAQFNYSGAGNTYSLPTANGTLALTSDIPSLAGYVPTSRTISTTGPLAGGGDLTVNRTLTINQATTSADGYLSATDWNTFNNKQSTLTFTSPLVNTSGTVSISQANTTTNGYLSSTDWNTFNGKQAALSGTGFVKISGSTISYDNSTYLTTTDAASTYALDSAVVHNTGNETVAGEKKFTGNVVLDGDLYLKQDSFFGGKTGYNAITTDTSGFFLRLDSGVTAYISLQNITSQKSFTLPNATGTIALTSDIPAAYTLPTASTSVLGGVKIDGSTITIDGSGVISASGSTYTLPTATDTVLGGVKIGSGVTITSGVISVSTNYQAPLSGTGLVYSTAGTITYDTNTYLTTSAASSTYLTQSSAASTYLPLTGGTLTGGLAINLSGGTGLNVASDNVVFRSNTGIGSPRQLVLSMGGGTLVQLQAKGYGANYITDFGIKTYNSSGTGFDVFYGTSAGLVGIGTTTPGAKLDVQTSSGTGSTTASGLARFVTATTSKAISIGQSDSGRRLDLDSYSVLGNGEDLYIGTTSANAFVAYVNSTERMRITSGGLLALGGTGASERFNITSGNQKFYTYQSSPGEYTYIGTEYSQGNGNNKAEIRFGIESDTYSFMSFATARGGGNISERVRITSNGYLLVGTSAPIGATTNTSVGATFALAYNWLAVTDSNYIQRSNNSNGDYFSFYKGSTSTGSISVSGTTTSYITTSDYRLKEDLKPINGLEILNKINVYDYKWKSDNSRMDGVLAHELQEILPYAVTGIKDGEKMQGVDYSKIVPVMVQAIKDLKAELDILKNK